MHSSIDELIARLRSNSPASFNPKEWLADAKAIRLNTVDLSDEARKIYSEEPLENGLLSRAAKAYQMEGDHDAAIFLWAEDLKLNRMPENMQVEYALALYARGQTQSAVDHLNKAYQSYSKLKDGFTQLGEFEKPKSIEKAIEFYEADLLANRLSHRAYRSYATLLAKSGDIEKAKQTIVDLYKLAPKETDGFARIADSLYGPQRDFEKISIFLKLENESGRASWFTKTLEARHAAIHGAPDRALSILANLYNSNQAYKCLYESVAKQLTNLCFFNLAEQFLDIEPRPSPQRDTLLKYLRFLRETFKAGLSLYAERDQESIASALNKLYSDPKEHQDVTLLNGTLKNISRFDAIYQIHEVIIPQSYRFKKGGKKAYIIDGGGNCGMSLLYFKWLFPDSYVEVFEPNPVLASSVASSVEHNKWDNVRVHNKALTGDDSHSAKLRIPCGNMMGSSISSSFEQTSSESQYVEVETEPLAPYLETPVDYLKLDIEGAETGVINQIADRISHIKSGYIEYHYRANSDGKNRLSKLLSVLDEKNIRYRIVPPFERTPKHFDRCDSLPSRWSCSILLNTTQ